MATRVATAVGTGGRSSVSGKKAVVFGAYGFIGRYVVNRLARSGTQVVIPYRCDPVNIRHLRPAGDLGMIRQVHCDPRNNNDLDLVTRDADVVLNLMGQDYSTMNWSLEQVHVDLAGRLAQIAADNKVGRFIQMSAVGADPTSPSDFYKTKARGEDIVREKFPMSTIVRSARVVGPEDKYSNRVATTFQRHPNFLPFPIPDGGRVMRAPVYVGDIGQALVEAMSHRDAPGETYELVGPEHMSYYEFIHRVGEIAMRDHFVGHLPYQALRAVAPLLDQPSRFLFKTTALSTDVIDQLVVDEKPSTKHKGLQDLGVPPTPFGAVGLRWLRRFRPPQFAHHTMEDAAYVERRMT